MVDLMPAGTISDLIRTVLSFIFERIAYTILDVVYEVFFHVATAEFFINGNELINNAYYKCQLIIGIFMLFKFAVTILEGIVDPARVTDKKNGAGKIITRIITSLVILALITPINIPNPSNQWEKELKNNGIIFGALYSLQTRILENNTLGKLILGVDKDTDEDSMGKKGSKLTTTLARLFIRPNMTSNGTQACDLNDTTRKIYEGDNAQQIVSLINEECSSQNMGSLFGGAISGLKKLTNSGVYVFAYSPIGGVAGYIISIIMIGFTVDIAIRSIKLAVLRLIAPIPIISHMSISAKEGKGADSFSLWVKAITTTYLDLFIRLAILYFAIFIVSDFVAEGITADFGDGITGAIAFVFVVIGLFLFVRQAPKFFEDVLGLQGTMSNIGLSAILAGAGAIRQGGTFRDATWAAQDAVDNNINAINSGKAPPRLGMSYNAGRDLAAQIITGNDKMTARAMQRGRHMLSNEGITPAIASKYKDDMYLQKGILQAMEDAQSKGYDESTGKYAVNYKTGRKDRNGNDIYQTKYIDKDDWAEAIAQQRDRTTQAESAYNDMKAEQQKYGQTVGYREKARGRKHPYLSARRQKQNAANKTSTMGENWHDNTAIDFNADNGVAGTIGDRL